MQGKLEKEYVKDFEAVKKFPSAAVVMFLDISISLLYIFTHTSNIV